MLEKLENFIKKKEFYTAKKQIPKSFSKKLLGIQLKTCLIAKSITI
ncbi:hypothetical protein [Flavobacterium reichenbachii]|nr:hypothetical protein [Flavobacterium reichenbachii]